MILLLYQVYYVNRRYLKWREWGMEINEENSLRSLFQNKNLFSDVLELVNASMKDTDAIEEKMRMRKMLLQVSETITFLAIGNRGVGKTSFLDCMLEQQLLEGEELHPTEGIHEIRYGVEHATVEIEKGHYREFRNKNLLQGIKVYDIQGIDTIAEQEEGEKVKHLANESDVVFAVFDVEQIRNYKVWDFIEGVDKKKVVFIMTRCDSVSEEQMQESYDLLCEYVEDEGYRGNVFSVSARWERDGVKERSGYQAVRSYLREEVLKGDARLTKQHNNMLLLRGVMEELEQSFGLRVRQYQADRYIQEKVDSALDSLMGRSNVVLEKTKVDVARMISDEVDNYTRTIIEKLDPYKIRDRFQGGQVDFENYLIMVTENYTRIMNEQIRGKVQASISEYLNSAAEMLEDINLVFDERQEWLDAEDRFYGSLVVSKQEMIAYTSTEMATIQGTYMTLTDASSELFTKVFELSKQHNKSLDDASLGGALGGGALGAGLLGSAMTGMTVGSATFTIAALAMPITMLLGAVVLGKFARNMAKAMKSSNFEREIRKCIEEYQCEIEQSKQQITEQVLGLITQLYQGELNTVDSSFIDFRTSVNIDANNIQRIEMQMEQISNMLEQLDDAAETFYIGE